MKPLTLCVFLPSPKHSRYLFIPSLRSSKKILENIINFSLEYSLLNLNIYSSPKTSRITLRFNSH